MKGKPYIDYHEYSKKVDEQQALMLETIVENFFPYVVKPEEPIVIDDEMLCVDLFVADLCSSFKQDVEINFDEQHNIDYIQWYDRYDDFYPVGVSSAIDRDVMYNDEVTKKAFACVTAWLKKEGIID